MKNERQKLASTSAPSVSAEPGGRGWLPSLRPSWLPAKADADASAKNAVAQQRAQEEEAKALTQEIAALKASLASEAAAKTQAAEQLAKKRPRANRPKKKVRYCSRSYTKCKKSWSVFT